MRVDFGGRYAGVEDHYVRAKVRLYCVTQPIGTTEKKQGRKAQGGIFIGGTISIVKMLVSRDQKFWDGTSLLSELPYLLSELTQAVFGPCGGLRK